MSEVVLSRPMDELPIANAKYVKNCTELYLGQKGITELDGFEPFVNLETLWINGNKLEYIDDLDDCERLQHLFAHNNIINSLDGSLQSLKHLITLSLANNSISDLDHVLEILKGFPKLQTLDLSGNPVAEEDNYRLRVIEALPHVHTLDGLRVKPTEVTKVLTKSKSGQSKKVKPKRKSKIQWKDNLSATVKLAEREHRRLEREQNDREQRAKLASFKNIEVLRTKSLKTAPISKYSQPPTYRTQKDGGDRLSEWDLHRGERLAFFSVWLPRGRACLL